MNVIVDTSIWSLALRRSRQHEDARERELVELIEEGRIVMLGPVRQELLSGIKSPPQFRTVRDHLRAFPDLALAEPDFEDAAHCFNRCRAKGIQGSNTDFLLCAVSRRHGFPIFTIDVDFSHYRSVLKIKLHRARE